MPPTPQAPSSYEHTVIVKGLEPGRSWRVAFTPVRGEIVEVARAEPEGVTATTAGAFMVRVHTPASMAPGADVSLTLRVCGEPPDQHAVLPGAAGGPAMRAAEVIGPSDWEPLYRARQNLVNDHAFFFELDRTTNPSFLPHMPASEIDEAERKARIADMDPRDPNSFIRQLLERLRLRAVEGQHRFKPMDPDASVRRFSSAFRAAARKHSAAEDWDAVGHSLLRFAAGHIMQNVLIPTVNWAKTPVIKSVLVAGPDSFYVFLFAEMAFCALELDDDPPDRDMWQGLLPYLVDMQRVYTSRFTERPDRLIDYAGIRDVLTEPPRLSLPQRDPDELAGVMISHLRAAANRFS